MNHQKAFPTKRQEKLKWNGWGYKDSRFMLNKETGFVEFTGERYPMSGTILPYLFNWFESELKGNTHVQTTSQSLDVSKIPPPKRCPEFNEEVRQWCKYMSEEPEDRLMHGHGHLCEEIYMLRNNMYFDRRIPDIVIHPSSHQDVEEIVKLANKYNIALIPMGGGTSVSGALICPHNEMRTIASLDMTEMNKIHWIDSENGVANVEAGIIGQDLERQLQEEGFTTGHQPDSLEFSSLGGWVATRASGMKKNLYGNIEDLIIRIRMVTSMGTMEKSCQVPRISSGPDIHEIILGSEGILGVITEVTIKIKPIPECVKYGSVIFPSMENGIRFLRSISKQSLYPASVRLLDNDQLRFGLALKSGKGLIERVSDHVKKMYLRHLRGFDPLEMVLCTIVFEGASQKVQTEESAIMKIASDFNGISAGEENGKTGYLLTFSIAYLRDFGFDFGFLSESFETSVPWDRVYDLINNVKEKIMTVCNTLGVSKTPFCSARVTQCYDSGACCYFYFGFFYPDLEDPLEAYTKLEESAREEVLANGGSISHHHGVGKVRAKFVEGTVSSVGKQALLALKKGLDPQNIFASGNIINVVGPTGLLNSKL